MITILIAIAAVCLIAAILLIFRMFSKLRDKNDKVYDEEFDNKNQSK